jgi:hypothetical protein
MSKWFAVRTSTVKYVLVEVAEDNPDPVATALVEASDEVESDEAELAESGPLDPARLESWKRHCDIDLPLGDEVSA